MDTKTCDSGHERPASVRQCADCRKESRKRYYDANRETILAKQKVYNEANREMLQAAKAAYREVNREAIRARETHRRDLEAHSARMRAYRAANPDKAKKYASEARKRLRLNTIRAYGSACACCNEMIERFLTLDHINNNGKEHRDTIGSGDAFYRWLRNQGYPTDLLLQVLCSSCNNGRHINGGSCPHAAPVTAPASRGQKYHRRVKTEVINHYGGACACCGENEMVFLTIDHVNNDGAEHRKLTGGGSSKTYRALRLGKFPAGFQVLCFNCNDGRHWNGGTCPHLDA